MQFLNLTPHDIKIFAQDGITLDRVIPASGKVARLDKRDGETFNVDGIVFKRPHFGDPLDLPEADQETMLIVSAMVRTAPALLSRTDLASPADFVRDASGQVLGCRSFDLN